MDTITSLLREFLVVEQNYQQARDYVIASLRQQYKGDAKKIFEFEHSHYNLSLKNKLMALLLDKIGNGIRPYAATLHELSDLTGIEHNNTALLARRMLTRFRFPSFDQRRVAMEKQLLEKHFEELASTPAPIFDILTSFFNHPSQEIRKLALEVYIRRAYRAYEVQNLTIGSQAEGSLMTLQWSYIPPFGWTASQKRASSPAHGVSSPAPSPSNPSGGSNFLSSTAPLTRVFTDDSDNLTSRGRDSLTASSSSAPFSSSSASSSHAYEEKEALQNGVAVLFDNEQSLLTHLGHVCETYSVPPTPLSPSSGATGEEFTNVLKIAVPEQPSDTLLSLPDDAFIARFSELMRPYTDALRRAKVRRVTVVVTRSGQYPRLFTFRERLNFEEHSIYRHIEPPLAYHLELRRLSNYDVQLISSENQQIHIYYAQERNNTKPVCMHWYHMCVCVCAGGLFSPHPFLPSSPSSDPLHHTTSPGSFRLLLCSSCYSWWSSTILRSPIYPHTTRGTSRTGRECTK